MSNDKDLEITGVKMTLRPNTRNTQLKYIGRIMRKDGLENMTLTGQGRQGKITHKISNEFEHVRNESRHKKDVYS